MALDFQPENTSINFQPEQAGGQIDFQPVDFQAESQSQPGTSSQGIPGVVSDDEINQIAQKHGVDPGKLRDIAPYFGVPIQPSTLPEAIQTGGKAVAGEIGQTVALGAPQFIYKKLQDEPSRQAIDELRNLGETKKSGMEKVTEFGRQLAAPIAFVPEIAGATATKRLATAAGIGAVAGLTGSEEGQELPSAAKGAAAGGALGIAGEALGKLLTGQTVSQLEKQAVRDPVNRDINVQKGASEVAEKTSASENILRDQIVGEAPAISLDNAEKLISEQISDRGRDQYLDQKRAEGIPDDQAIQDLAQDVINTRLEKFAEDLSRKSVDSPEEAYNTIEKISSRQGEDYVASRYEGFVRREQANKYIADNEVVSTSQRGFFGDLANKTSDAQYTFRDIDMRNGTNTERILRNANKDLNRGSFINRELIRRRESEFNEVRNALTPESSDKIYEALDTGNMEGLTPAETKAAQDAQKYFEDVRQFANQRVTELHAHIPSLNVPAVEHYVPHYTVPTPEVITRVERAQSEALESLSQKLGRDVTDISELSRPEFQEAMKDGTLGKLNEFLNWKDGEAATSANNMQRRLGEALYTRDGNLALEMRARSAEERTGGEIPEWLQEHNIFRLKKAYADNIMKTLFLRSHVDEMRNTLRVLERAGAVNDAAYVRNWLQDMSGIRKGTAAEAFMQANVQFSRGLDRMISKTDNPVVRGGLTALKAIPNSLSSGLNQIYPNMVGWSTKGALLHLATSLTRMAPEIGGLYGAQVWLRAATRSVVGLRSGLIRMREMGFSPAERLTERALAEGIQKTSLYRLSSQVVEGMARAGMMALHKAVELNRVVAMHAGEILAEDIAGKSPAALQALNRFPSTIRQEVLQNPQKAAEVLGGYLNDTCLYNYNRISKSEIGRSFGPLFSAFTKIPTATAGDILSSLRERGAISGAGKILSTFMLPWALLRGVDYALGKKFDEDTRNDVTKLVSGQKGLAAFAPIESIEAMAGMDVGVPPVADLLYQDVIHPVLQGKSPNARKTAAHIFQDFAPGAGPLKFVTQDMVTFLTGRRPEGQDYLERTQAGIKQLKK